MYAAAATALIPHPFLGATRSLDPTTLHIPNELFAPAESSSFAGVLPLDCLQAGPDAYTFASPLAWNVVVSNTGGALLVAGNITGNGKTACARCLEPLEVAINGEVEGYFLLDAQDAEFEEGEEEEFERLGPENTIDLVPLLEAAVLMDLPLQPLCRDDCAGLCPDCGINLNIERCDCAQKRAAENEEFEAAKNPFSVLKELDLNALSE